MFFEKILNRITKIGFYKTRVLINKNNYKNSNVIISFNDAYSLNIGLYYKKEKNQKIIGIFHGLSDFETKTPIIFRKFLYNKIMKSISNMDFCFFLSTNDLKNVRKKYNLKKYNSDKFIFGIDINFWKKKSIVEDIDILCVGSDLNRNYEILRFIPRDIEIKLITSLKISFPNHENIEKIKAALTIPLLLTKN